MSSTDVIPLGYCQCGCGAKTGISPNNNAKARLVKGQPFRYLRGHAGRRTGAYYRVEDRGYVTHCWIWQLGTDGGYGRIKRDGRMQQAHRYFYEQAHGPLPLGHEVEVHHKCEQKLCINTEHLDLLPLAEHRREHSSSATWAAVEEIRRRSGSASRRELADEFGLSLKQIRDIVAGRTWRKEK